MPKKTTPIIAKNRKLFHAELCKQLLWLEAGKIATNADSHNAASVEIAGTWASKIGAVKGGQRLPGQTAGEQFEAMCAHFIKATFLQIGHLRPGEWVIRQGKAEPRIQGIEICNFAQYAHLRDIKNLADEHPQLKTVLGGDYFIIPDVVVFRLPEEDAVFNRHQPIVDGSCSNLAPLRKKNAGTPILHASISCKWTIRSDRTQNSRSEALNLIRNRKGNTPHIMVVTAEPLPSRLAAIALGTGDIDCVYHVALTELQETLRGLRKHQDAAELLRVLVEGRRLRDISDLPIDLAV